MKMSIWTFIYFGSYCCCDKYKGFIFSKGYWKILGWRRFDEYGFLGFVSFLEMCSGG